MNRQRSAPQFAETLANQAYSNCSDVAIGDGFTIDDAISSLKWVAQQLAAIDHGNEHTGAVVAMRTAAQLLEADVRIDLGQTG